MLYQLPPRWAPNHERLEAFLAAAPAGERQAIEIRDPRWYGPQLTAALEAAGVVYVRFHGAGARYGGRYSPQRLTAWAERMTDWAGWPVWAYFNNDIGGHAPRDADRLRGMLACRGVP